MAKTKTAASKQKATAKDKSAGSEEVKVCRRTSSKAERRDENDGLEQAADGDVSLELEDEATEATAEGANPPERRKVQRRRQIDPTTCERDYTGDEIEFMHALDAYKRANGRMFPTCSEILEVVRSLGYERVLELDEEVDAAELENADATTPSEDTHLTAEGSESDADPLDDGKAIAETDQAQVAGFH